MKVNEIFYSIEGEGIRTGALATFVRFTGCNLRCSYCDTKYAFSEGKELSMDEIIAEVENIGCRNVTVTGGEPLLQGIDLIRELCMRGYEVNVETCGALPIEDVQFQNSIVTMDYKTPSSGMENKMLLSNIPKLRKQDVLKFVCAREDFDAVKRVYEEFCPACPVYISPVFGKCEPIELVELAKEIGMPNVHVQVQLHKIIWKPEERGV